MVMDSGHGGSTRNEQSAHEFGSVAGTFTMSYPKWCAMLVPMVLKSRASFSSFLCMTIRLIRGSPLCTASTPAFFPVPVYSLGQFDRMPSTVSASTRKLIHLRRAVHTFCVALNFWHRGGRWPTEASLRRKPDSEHGALFKRVVSLLRSDGLAESFPLTKSGRKDPEFNCKVVTGSYLGPEGALAFVCTIYIILVILW